MFGYVTPDKPELKVCELARYQAWYCGLCKTIRQRYGQMPRLALDYDCTFLALLLAAAAGEEFSCRPERCGYKPWKAKAPVIQPCEALAYAADINVLLYWRKLDDDCADEHKPLALIGRAALTGAARKACVLRPEAAVTIEEGICALSQLEKAREPSIDKAADAFAGMLRSLAAGYPTLEERQRRTLSWLGYHLGRWIYLADAWEDREKDWKTGSYNPFLIADTTKERASFLLYAALHETELACDLLNLQSDKGLIENILYRGCRMRTKRLLEGVKG